jgi:hypothetical protein
MSHAAIVDNYEISSLQRRARTARLQACRASPLLERQLKLLAERYEAEASRMRSLEGSTGPALNS